MEDLINEANGFLVKVFRRDRSSAPFIGARDYGVLRK